MSGRLGAALWRAVYQLAVHLAVPIVSVLMVWRGLRDRSQLRNFRERFGFGARPSAPAIWVHAASVGEVQAAAGLIATLRQRHPDIPLVVTCMTATGVARGRALFDSPVQVRYLPFDLPGCVWRFLSRIQPRIAVIFETELWPNLYRACGRRRVPLIIASARLSQRSVERYQWLGALFRDTLSQGVLVAAQAEADAGRYRALGAEPDRVRVTGNLKFDLTLPPGLGARGEELRSHYAAERPMWVAGSTREGEEELVLRAHAQVRERHPQALLVLAPRHPVRFDAVAAQVASSRLDWLRRSQDREDQRGAQAGVLLLDSLGELLGFYAAADVAFVGGSLVPLGGHNLLEPAAVGIPILTGPHNENSPDIARQLLECGAAEIVRDASELAVAVSSLLGNAPERARRGAAGRQ